MDIILKETVSQGHLGVNIGKECFTDLDYADNVALLAVSCGDVVDSLEKMGQEASKFGLESNWSKTKIQGVGVQGSLPTEGSLPRSSESASRALYLIMVANPGATRWNSSPVSPTLAPTLRQIVAAVRRVAVVRDCMSSLQRGIWKSGNRIDSKLRLVLSSCMAPKLGLLPKITGYRIPTRFNGSLKYRGFVLNTDGQST